MAIFVSMKKLTAFFKNPWIVGVGTILIAFLLTDVIFKQNLLLKAWNWLIQMISTNTNFSIWVILVGIIGIVLFLFIFIKIRNFGFNNVKNSKIGEYTFRELHRILRTEHIRESNSVLIKTDFSQFSLLEIFDACHSRLSAGVNIENDLFLYHDVCPRLYLFSLMDKEDEKFKSPDLITHHYTMNENGKKFWTILNKLSIKYRLKEEKAKELKKRIKQ